jgi:hypothetical protein
MKSDAPLITKDNMEGRLKGTLWDRADWMKDLVHASREFPGLDFEDHVFVVLVGEKYLYPVSLRPTQLAILLELTRFAHSVSTDKADGNVYPKLICGTKTEDNITLARLWLNAGAREDVLAAEVRTDHRPEGLDTRLSGRARKLARETAIAFAVNAASEAATLAGPGQLTSFTVKEYEANLRNLFASLDDRTAELGMAT